MSDRLTDLIKRAREIIERAVSEFKPSHIFVLFSGGHDSVVAADLATKWRACDAIAHIGTGIGIKETRAYVGEVCTMAGWHLLEYKATENTKADGSPDPQVYREIVLKHGFPGPPQHGAMYSKLKERQIRRLLRDCKLPSEPHRKVLLITGVRQAESIRRMGHVKPVQVEGRRVWVAPLMNFTKEDCLLYMDREALPHNPVVDNLGMSGECLCGAFASKGELDRIARFYPNTAGRIVALEREVNEAGFPWGWEERQPEWFGKFQDGQDFLSDDFMPLCMSCPSRRGLKRAPEATLKGE